jgi:hypothetical protein
MSEIQNTKIKAQTGRIYKILSAGADKQDIQNTVAER